MTSLKSEFLFIDSLRKINKEDWNNCTNDDHPFIQYEFLLLKFLFNKSFPIILISNPIGVTTAKKIIPITNGEIIFPNKIPNLNQILFNGVNIFEFIKSDI